MRQLSSFAATAANFVGMGLGYVYVGRMRNAFILICASLLFLAAAGWLRLVFHPHLVYLVFAIAIVFALTPVAHCLLIVSRNKSSESKFYNKGWVYFIWVIGSLLMFRGLVELRPVLFGYEAFSIPFSSMAPTLARGDYVMSDTSRFKRASPAYGDLVVFEPPDQSGSLNVKRLIGLPDDVVEIRADILYRNQQPINEPYIALSTNGRGIGSDFGPVNVPRDSYFVLGDNRHNSRDSRVFGAVPRDLLTGRIENRWFSYDGGIQWNRFPEVLSMTEEPIEVVD